MVIKITDEMRQALDRQSNRPLEVEDDLTQKTYLLVSQEKFRLMIDQELRHQLQIGFDQADSGDVNDWDVDEILAEAHRRFAEKPM